MSLSFHSLLNKIPGNDSELKSVVRVAFLVQKPEESRKVRADVT